MFGMGFMEIFFVLVIAIVALGPEKLPTAVVDIAKFFKKFKSGIDDAKSTINNELNISELRKEADNIKASMEDVKHLAKIDMHSINTDKIIDFSNEPVMMNKQNKKENKDEISLKDKEV